MPSMSSQDIRSHAMRSWGVRAALLLAATIMASSALAQQPPAPAKPAPAAPKPESRTTLAAATANDVQPTLLGQYGDWGAYYATPGGKKVCFAIAKPKSSQTNPAGRKRDPAWLFVASRPAENVRNEVSVIIGYPFKPQTEASAEIGSVKFAMQTLNDGAWIKNVAEEARMVEAMRKGSDLTIKGMSGHGTESTDQYALKGLTQAIEKADQECK
jgi:hypothetical protein